MDTGYELCYLCTLNSGCSRWAMRKQWLGRLYLSFNMLRVYSPSPSRFKLRFVHTFSYP
jgi:hypothetical protein